MNEKNKIGLFGFGCVGQGFYDIFHKNDIYNAEIKYICVRDRNKNRPLSEDKFVFNKEIILNDPEINIIVELISDTDEAFEIVKLALKQGKKVISANKKMIAHHLPELISLQKAYSGTLLYEAACCGSIPVIRNLEDFFAFEEVNKIRGIFNGSSNYILSKVSQEGLSYDKALEQAQELGFAEADPLLDVGGYDALNKLCIIIHHALGVSIPPSKILNLGIQFLKADDNFFASEKRWKLKQIAFAAQEKAGDLKAWVLPQFIEGQEDLFNIDQEYNAVNLETSFAGAQLFKGKGAGAHPTGAAVFSDFKAISTAYHYRYPKKNNVAVLNNDTFVKVYVSSEKESDLQQLSYKTISEKGKTGQLYYLIGEVTITALKNAKAFIEQAEIFVAIMPEREQQYAKKEIFSAEALI